MVGGAHPTAAITQICGDLRSGGCEKQWWAVPTLRLLGDNEGAIKAAQLPLKLATVQPRDRAQTN
jgi:hypothetical protein